MSERKIRTFHIPIDRVRQYLTVEEIQNCVGGHVKCAIYADVEAGRKLILGNGIRALLGLADAAVDMNEKDAAISQLKENEAKLKAEIERLKSAVEKLDHICQIMFDPENQPPQYSTEKAFEVWRKMRDA